MGRRIVREVARAVCTGGDKAEAVVWWRRQQKNLKHRISYRRVLSFYSARRAGGGGGRGGGCGGGGGGGSGSGNGNGSTWFQERAAVVGFQFRREGQRQLGALGYARLGGLFVSARYLGAVKPGTTFSAREEATPPRKGLGLRWLRGLGEGRGRMR